MARLTARNPFARPRKPTEVVDGVWLLGTQRVNFYALTEGRSVTLVDAGFYGHLRYLNEWLDATGRRDADIEAIVLTHGHGDHFGFAGDFARRGVPVYVHESDAALVGESGSRRPPIRMMRNLWRLSTLPMLAEAAVDSVFSQPSIRGARTFRDGEHIDVPGRLRATHIPGHSEGNCTLHHPGLDAMFTGDALMMSDPMFGGEPGPIVFGEDPANDELCFENLKLLRPFSSASVLPGHGEPDPIGGALGTAIDNARIAKPDKSRVAGTHLGV